MAELDEETKQKRLKVTRIVWVVFGVIALLATLFLPGILAEKNKQERESQRPTTSYNLDR